MSNVANDVLNLWDQRIEQSLQAEYADDVLIDTYFELWAALKDRVGTSSGFTGFSEYLFFRYILKSDD